MLVNRGGEPLMQLERGKGVEFNTGRGADDEALVLAELENKTPVIIPVRRANGAAFQLVLHGVGTHVRRHDGFVIVELKHGTIFALTNGERRAIRERDDSTLAMS